MTDKELIKEEIERLKEHTAKCGYQGQGEFENGNREGRNYVCDKLLSFIDSLQEESKCIYNRTLEERKKFCKYCSAFCDVRIKEESESEDLEEEILNKWEEYPHTLWAKCPYNDFKNIARHFAEWQKHKDQETIELAEDHAMLAGMNKMKEKMMGNAVLETKVMMDCDGDGIETPYEKWLTLEDTEIPSLPDNLGLKEGDKVKIIIIKEEQQ